MRTHKAMAIAMASLGMMLGGPAAVQTAQAREIPGETVAVQGGSYLYCKFTATSRRPVDLTVTLDLDGVPVNADFGTTLRSGNGPYSVEVRAGVFSKQSDPALSVLGSCRVLFQGRLLDSSICVCGSDAQGGCACL